MICLNNKNIIGLDMEVIIILIVIVILGLISLSIYGFSKKNDVLGVLSLFTLVVFIALLYLLYQGLLFIISVTVGV